jgi:hypothetical protein
MRRDPRSPTSLRRDALVVWLAYRALTAGHIANFAQDADGAWLYSGHGKADRAFDDLKALEKQGRVERLNGRPARWRVREEQGGDSEE